MYRRVFEIWNFFQRWTDIKIADAKFLCGRKHSKLYCGCNLIQWPQSIWALFKKLLTVQRGLIFTSISRPFSNPHELTKIFYKILKCTICPSTLFPNFWRYIRSTWIFLRRWRSCDVLFPSKVGKSTLYPNFCYIRSKLRLTKEDAEVPKFCAISKLWCFEVLLLFLNLKHRLEPFPASSIFKSFINSFWYWSRSHDGCNYSNSNGANFWDSFFRDQNNKLICGIVQVPQICAILFYFSVILHKSSHFTIVFTHRLLDPSGLVFRDFDLFSRKFVRNWLLQKKTFFSELIRLIHHRWSLIQRL